MGAFKPLLPVGGQSAVARAVHLAKQAGVERVTVVTGYRSCDVGAELRRCGLNVDIVHNARYDDGMLSSVIAGARALCADTEAFFLLPVDCCAVSQDTLKRLLSASRRAPGRVVYPVFNGAPGHPPLIPAGVLSSIGEFDGEGGMRAYLSRFRRLDVRVDDPGAAADMDTPEGYAALLRILGLPTYPDEGEALALLERYGTPGNIVAHCKSVARVADALARRCNGAGADIDVGLLRSSCLLHDICRREPDHARAGMLLLLSLGYPEAAMAVGRHMEMPPERVDIDASMLLYLADKLCRAGGTVPLEATLRDTARRFAADPAAYAAARARITRAMDISRALEERYGVVAESDS
jgi:CTP:molybdopterin cytidylyltransferase MocA